MAIGRISAFSYPRSPVYVPPTDSEWIAVHTGHTEIAPDCCYIESDLDWTGVHTSYDDVYIPSEPELEEELPLPDFQAMRAAVYAAETRNLDDSVISASSHVSDGGTLNFTLQRQGSGPPPTEVKVNVLGTSISTWQTFASESLTIDMAVHDLPPGTHTIEVLAYAGGRVVGTTQFTISVAGPPVQAPAPAEPEPTTEAPQQAPPEPLQWQRPPEPAALQDPPRTEAPQPFRPPLGVQTPAASRPASAPAWLHLDPRIAPAAPQTVGHPVSAPGVYVAGQAMASGMGAQVNYSPKIGETESDDVPLVQASAGAMTDGHSDEHRPPHQQRDEGEERKTGPIQIPKRS